MPKFKFFWSEKNYYESPCVITARDAQHAREKFDAVCGDMEIEPYITELEFERILRVDEEEK
jgi:hypothetical protein